MFKPTTAIRALIGATLVLLVAIPASAQTGSSNLLVTSGVTFLPSQDEDLTVTEAAVPLKFETPIAGFNTFVLRQTEDPHTFAAGLRSGGYAFGIGGVARFWFTQKFFIDAGISHYGYAFAGYTGFSQNTVMASLLYMFKRIDNDSMIFRIYAGGGININTWNYNTGINDDSRTEVGGQGLAGLEMIVKQLPKLGFGAEVGVYQGPDEDFVNAPGIGGFSSMIYAVWYFK